MTRRVVHYLDSDTFGGSEVAALQLAASLDRGRWEPVLLHHGEPGIGGLLERAAALDIRTSAVARVDPDRELAGVRRLHRALTAERPAVLHVHLSWPLACKYGVLAGWLGRVPAIVATAHLYLQFPGYWQQRLMMKAVRQVIAVSREVKIRYARELHVPERKLAVVHNGISLQPATPAAAAALRAELVRGRPDYLVLTPARLHEQKGHAYLLAAAAQVPDATFVLAGDGPLRSDLETRARELGVADRCIFLGHRSDVPALLAAADLFLLPSLFEGLPVSVVEAMVAGRPVIATAIGGTDEAIIHEVTGLLVPTRDPAALASAIRRLKGDPALASRLAAAGRERALREFSPGVAAGTVMGIYDELVDAGQRTHVGNA